MTKNIKTEPHKYNLSSNDLIQRNIIKKYSGYTGTLYIENIIDIDKLLDNNILMETLIEKNKHSSNIIDGILK